MTTLLLLVTDLEPREQGWAWWLLLVAGLVVMFLVLISVRRRSLRPLNHRPTDTTDAWVEAGRRFHLPPAAEGRAEPPKDGDEPEEPPS